MHFGPGASYDDVKVAGPSAGEWPPAPFPQPDSPQPEFPQQGFPQPEQPSPYAQREPYAQQEQGPPFAQQQYDPSHFAPQEWQPASQASPEPVSQQETTAAYEPQSDQSVFEPRATYASLTQEPSAPVPPETMTDAAPADFGMHETPSPGYDDTAYVGETAAFHEYGGADGPPPPYRPDEPGFGGPPRGRRRARASQGIKIAAAAAAVAVVVGGVAGGWALTSGGSDGSPAAQSEKAPMLTDAQRQAADEERRKQLKDRASRHAREEADDAPKLALKGTPPAKKDDDSTTTPPLSPVTPGSARAIAKKMLPSFGFGADQFGCLDRLWMRESGWRTTAANPSGAYGIPQALPGSKMASAGPNWRTDARTQIKWGLGYIKGRYKTPCGGWAHFQSNGWY